MSVAQRNTDNIKYNICSRDNWWDISVKEINKEFFSFLSNRQLSGAKSALPGETMGVCSSYKRGDQPPYNLPVAHLRFTGIFPQVGRSSYECL